MKGWLKPKAAANYCDVGERTLRTWISEYSLRHIRVKGVVLIKVSWIDEFLQQHEVSEQKQTDQIVDEVCKAMKT